VIALRIDDPVVQGRGFDPDAVGEGARAAAKCRDGRGHRTEAIGLLSTGVVAACVAMTARVGKTSEQSATFATTPESAPRRRTVIARDPPDTSQPISAMRSKKRASPCPPTWCVADAFSIVTDPPRIAAAAAGYVAAVRSPGMVTDRAFTFCGATTKCRIDARSTRTPRPSSAVAVMSMNGALTSSPLIRRLRPPRMRGATSRRADANWLDS